MATPRGISFSKRLAAFPRNMRRRWRISSISSPSVTLIDNSPVRRPQLQGPPSRRSGTMPKTTCTTRSRRSLP